MKKSTNLFYAIFYSIWSFHNSISSLIFSLLQTFTFVLPKDKRTKVNHRFEKGHKITNAPNDLGINAFFAIKIMGFLLLSNYCVFLGPMVKVIKKCGISSYFAAIITIGLFLIVLIKLNDSVFDESHYHKYFIEYDKRRTSWKIIWGIITFIYIIISFACLFYGAESYQRINN